MAFLKVYNNIGPLRMVHTGNSLGLNQNPRIVNDITQTLMITLDPALNVAGTGVPSDTGATTYGGTTRDWTQAGSWANLNVAVADVPIGATINYAQLIWETNYGVPPQPTYAQCQTTTVNFVTPDSIPHPIFPQTSDNGGYNTATMSADVTQILNNVISISGIDRALGNYSLSGVPIALAAGVPGIPSSAGGPSFIGAGWGLLIFYTHPALPYNSETLYVGNLQDGTTQQISGFYTPEAGPVPARIFVQASLASASQADNFTVNNLFASGPNNQHNPPWTVNNFLASTVCDYLGNLQLISSFGNANMNPSTYDPGVGNKTEFQITNVPVDNYIPNAVRSTNILSAGDGSNMAAFGLEVKVNQAFFAPIKSANRKIYQPGDTVTYTIPFTNTGGTTATNVVVTDTLPSQLIFIPGTVTINGTPQPSATLTPLTLPDIGYNQTVTVTFQATVGPTAVQGSTIPNNANISYNFIPDPSLPIATSSNDTSIAVIGIYTPTANLTKSASPSPAGIGDTITYTISVNNTDPYTYVNVVFQDTIPPSTTFVPGSFTINGIPSAQNPSTPISLGTLPGNSVTTLTFQVKLGTTLPTPNPVPNTSRGTFFYKTAIGNVIAVATVPSNQTLTPVLYTSIDNATGGFSKTANRQYSVIGDTITYTLGMTNTGNTTADNVILTDTIPPSTVFVPGSVTVDGVVSPGGDPTPPGGINVGSIGPGQTVTLTFDVAVVSIPTTNPIPNDGTVNSTFITDPSLPPTSSVGNSATATVTIKNVAMTASKSVDKGYATLGDTLTYTIVFNLQGNTPANNVILTDSIPPETLYIANSLTLNGTAIPGANPNPPTGYNLGSLVVPATYTVTFKTIVQTVPTPNPIFNNAVINYAFTANPTRPNNQVRTATTNFAPTTIVFASLAGITKSVDKPFVDCSDIITYTIDIPNSGNVDATNVVFKDTLPADTIFVTDSVTVNGVPQPGVSPVTGVPVGTIAAGSFAEVTFQVQVICP